MPKRDFKKEKTRPNEVEFQVCRFCGTLFEYGDHKCPACGRKPSDEEQLTDYWTKSEQK